MEHLLPCKRDPKLCSAASRQKLGLTAQEEAAVDRVEAGDSAVHRGLARPYLSFQNGRRSSQAQALCSQRAKEEKPHRTSRSSSAIARPRLQAPEGREREHGVGWGGGTGVLFSTTLPNTLSALCCCIRIWASHGY